MFRGFLKAGVAALLVVAASGGAAAQTIYVDSRASGAGTGSSWHDAFNYLQDGLAAAVSGDEVRAASGVYRPDRDYAHPNGSGDRMAVFQLEDGVALRGGYAGLGGAEPNARDNELYETVLSGDLNGDDGSGFLNNQENSYHVVSGSGTKATAVLDGFTVRGGNANGVEPHSGGGGMLMYFGSATVLNCTFRGNRAIGYGGGVFNYMFSEPVLVNCKFVGNTAEYGGGIENRYYSECELINCLFTGNTAFFGGGGIGNSGASLAVGGCTVADNLAARRGGGIYSRFDSDCRTVNSIFAGNLAAEGEEIALWYNCVLEASYCDFQGGRSCVQVVESLAYWGPGNVECDPCFVQDGCWGSNGVWVDGDYHLTAGSCCIDSGDNAEVGADDYDLDGDGDTEESTPFDVEGSERFIDGDNDGNDIVDLGALEFFRPPVAVEMKFTPRVLNPVSKGRWVKAHFVLPEEFGVGDVDVNQAAVIEPGGIESEYMNVFINDDGLLEIEAGFERAALCGLVVGGEAVEIRVTGSLTSGQQFYGTGTVRITSNYLQHVGTLASYWLCEDCGEPEWCGGADVDRDGVVNFADLAVTGFCCIEITAK